MPWKFFTKDGAEKRIPTSIVNPMVKAYSTAATSIPNTTLTVIPLEVEEYDTDGMHDTAANNSRITIKHAGTYLFVASISWASNATGLREILFRKNGVATYFGESILGAVSGSFTSATVSTTLVLNAGDYIELIGYQNSGGSLALGISAGYAAWMSATKIDGAVVSYVGVPGSLVGQEIGYSERTSGFTASASSAATAADMGMSITLTADGVTPYMLEFWAAWVDTSAALGAYTAVHFAENGTRLADWDVIVRAPAAAMTSAPIIARKRIVPTAGSHTYTMRAWSSGGTGTINAGPGGVGNPPPMFMRITRAA